MKAPLKEQPRQVKEKKNLQMKKLKKNLQNLWMKKQKVSRVKKLNQIIIKIEPKGEMAEWLKAADCKSADECLRRFESFSPHAAGVVQW